MYICIDICRYVHTYVGVSMHIRMYYNGFVKHVKPGIQTCSYTLHINPILNIIYMMTMQKCIITEWDLV